MEVRFQEPQRKTKLRTKLTAHSSLKKRNILINLSVFLFFAEILGWKAASYFFLQLLEHRAAGLEELFAFSNNSDAPVN